MAIIHIKLKPRSIGINSGRGEYSGNPHQNIYMRGVPEYDGNASLEFKNDGQRVSFPRAARVNISVRESVKDWYWERDREILANSWVDENSKFIGFLHYLRADTDSEMCIDRPDLLEMSIYVSEEQLALYINLINSRKSIITAVGTLLNGTMNNSIAVEPLGYNVTWDLDKSYSVCLESFNLNFTFLNEEIEEDDESIS